MVLLQVRSRRKSTGGRFKRLIVKRKFDAGRSPTHTRLAAFKSKTFRTIGGNSKSRLLSSEVVNVFNPSTKKNEKVKISNIIDNPANPHFVRRNIITKGSIVQTEIGKARITSRPGQCTTVNAVLLAE